MDTKTRMVGGAVLAAFFAAGVHVSLANGADGVSAPDDQAATEKLNNTIANCNKSEDDRYRAQEAQFQRERQQNQRVLTDYQAQNESLHNQYDDLRANYALLELRNDEQGKETAALQQKYQDTQATLQDMQIKYDEMLKKYQAIQDQSKPSESGIGAAARRLFGG